MKKRIYYHDTDAGGVVYYANYLKYLEEARTEFLEQKGLNIPVMQEHGLIFAVRQCSATYRAPARYGDTLECTATLLRQTAAQLFFEQHIALEGEKDRLLVTAEVSLVCLNQSFRAIPIPDSVRQLLQN